jgi:hypothetical protein
MTMFRRANDEHFIDNGSVYCSVHKRDVELDLCAGCRWMTQIDLDAKNPVVRCRPELPPQWIVRSWL